MTTKTPVKPAAPNDTIAVTLARGEAKVNSVRFDAAMPDEGQPKPALSSIYLANAADEALGQPEVIVVTITAAA